MGRFKTYQPHEKFKDYTLATTKPFKSHMFYEEKVWTLPQQIYKKMKDVSELLESLYPKLTDAYSKNIQETIKKHVETLVVDLGKMQKDLDKNPSTFNTKHLKTNKHSILEMKSVCDKLQTVSTYEPKFKKLGNIKHSLTELEHLIQPTSFENNYQENKMKSKPKTASTTKPIAAKKKVTKPKLAVKAKKLSAAKAKPKAKKVVPIKSKAKAPAKKALPTKSKPKTLVKKALPAKSKPKTLVKKVAAIKSKPKAKAIKKVSKKRH